MTETRFTPGPWKSVAESPTTQVYYVTSDRGTIATVWGRADHSMAVSGGDSIANAHLIAAALDLYEACAEIVALEGPSSRWSVHHFDIEKQGQPSAFITALTHMEAALAKARGET